MPSLKNAVITLVLAAAAANVSADTTEDRTQKPSVTVRTVREYNELQRQRAFDPAMLEERQSGDTCVFYQARSALVALGKPVISAEQYRAAAGKLENSNLTMLPSVGIEADFYAGGILGAANSIVVAVKGGGLNWENSAEVFRRMEKEVDAGKVVLMGVDSRPLHRAIAEQLRISPPDRSGPHSIRVLGLHRDEAKVVDKVYVYDTSGPEGRLRYSVPYQALKAAYNSYAISSRMNRAVFVSAGSAFPEVVFGQQ